MTHWLALGQKSDTMPDLSTGRKSDTMLYFNLNDSFLSFYDANHTVIVECFSN